MLEVYIQNNYLRGFVALVLYLFVLRLFLLVLQRIGFFFTRKTKTELDDKLLKNTSRPLTYLALLIALRFSLLELSLSEDLLVVLFNLIHSLSAVVVGILIYEIFNILIINLLKDLARKTKSTIDNTILSLFSSIVNTALVLFVFIYILSIWGVEIAPLLAGLGIAGLAVALALQPILSNIFSGAAIILDHSVKKGDLVYIDATTGGKIVKIGLRSTKIKTFDNEFIIVPNNKLSESNIQNVALPEPKTRVTVPFGVAYGSDVDKVKKIILAEIKKVQNVVDDPEPVIRFLEMADSSLNFKAYFFVDTFDNRIGAIDEANTRIYKALNKAKIEIPFPQMDVHVKK